MSIVDLVVSSPKVIVLLLDAIASYIASAALCPAGPPLMRRSIGTTILVSAFQYTIPLVYLLEIPAVLSAIHPDATSPLLGLWNTKCDIETQIDPVLILTSIALLLGTLGRIACYRELGCQFTTHITIIPEHKLITSGPYSIIRHPSYTSLFICFAAVATYCVHQGSWLRSCVIDSSIGGFILGGGWVFFVPVFSIPAGIRRTIREDALLKDHFGKQWEDWATTTRYRLVPYLF
ncbi:hypothetical protein K474DRAFT_624179 [Panus rudis PR-1116 ss-1]|nr:hypothetical protein K474DRAFT_624179 [Panus rudis PR-1116 ss-1]